MPSVHAMTPMETIYKLKNDKEVIIRSIKKSERTRVTEKFPSKIENDRITNVFYSTIKQFIDTEDQLCELRLIDLLKTNFEKARIDHTEEGMQDIFIMLRLTHAIDDILYDILTGVNKDFNEIGILKLNKKLRRISFKHKKLLNSNDLGELFSGFKVWPDESSRCSYNEFIYVKNAILNKDKKLSDKKSQFKVLIEKAYKANVFDLATFNKLEYLRKKSFIMERNYWLKDYFKVIFNAKNKMRPIKATYVVKNIEDEDGFTTDRIRRFSRMTRRQLLYKKYDETQIILLAQTLQKASRRMGVDPDTESGRPVITQEFRTLTESGERETYVEKIELDPQSQYNLARRLLRKDMTELQMMEAFVGLKITYEDLVMASFETGYITFEDLEFVVKYDDLWNPNKTDFERIIGFTFNIAGVSSIFLPPPWNISATIALGVIEGLILNTRRNGAENDNPATFIE